tara:strand:- start:2600 stop:3190 length:591 start_codon:yes stop_codon:yes gene_type:complete
MVTRSVYKGIRGFNPGQGLPVVSTDLDSVRAYQFEIQFEGVPGGPNNADDLTIAAKQVSQTGMVAEDIVIDRVNDKIFYPGKATPELITVTFDNLYLKETSDTLFQWFQNTYDPLTGELTKNAAPGVPGGGSFKANKMTILQLANNMDPHSAIECYGVWVKSWKTAEFNYATNEFHTIEVEFRYDFMNHIANSQLS